MKINTLKEFDRTLQWELTGIGKRTISYLVDNCIEMNVNCFEILWYALYEANKIDSKLNYWLYKE